MSSYIKASENPIAFLTHLESRGLIHDQTPELKTYLEECTKSHTVPKVYIGFDPSAPSLQIGNALSALLLRRAQMHGFQPIILLGGATGLIGDPSGKKQERNLLDKDAAQENLQNIKKQLANLIDTDKGKFQAKFMNNYDWFKNFTYIDFLRGVGKHITINYMIAKESVKIRMETGISYAEFGYMLIQGFDFLHLFETEHCCLQLGGSDQWGNMTTGIELIRRKHQKTAHAVSAPLLTDAAGNKLGKTEGGAIYLSPEMTTPYQFYQFFLNRSDIEVTKLLKTLTLFHEEHIENLERDIATQPEKRNAQKALAEEITKMIHGEETAQAVQTASEVLFSKNPQTLQALSKKALEILSQEVPCTHLTIKEPINILDLLVLTKLTQSKGEARRHIKGGAISLDRQKITDENFQLNSDAFASKPFVLLGLGKSQLHLLLKK